MHSLDVPPPAAQVKKIERGEAEPPPLAFYGDEPEDEEDWEEEDEGKSNKLKFLAQGTIGLLLANGTMCTCG